VSRLTDLIAQARAKDAQLGADLEREFRALSSRRAFGLNFERHRPEAVELPHRAVRKGDKVRVLPERGSTKKGDKQLWLVRKVARNKDSGVAQLALPGTDQTETKDVPVDDLVVVAEFRDLVYPGLVSTGKVERGAEKPFHTVINGENYHVLKALTYTHRGEIDAIYIDPPYNGGARDWKYNNDYVEAEDLYRHSKWLAMMERRLKIAQELLNPAESILLVTIDEKEYLRLGLLLEQLFPGHRIQMISTAINPKGSARGKEFYRVDEYVYVVYIGRAEVHEVLPITGLCISKSDSETPNSEDDVHAQQPQTVRWASLLRSGKGAQREESHLKFYPVLVDVESQQIVGAGDPLPLGEHPDDFDVPKGLTAVWPIRQNGTEGRWQLNTSSFRALLDDGYLKIGSIGRKTNKITFYYLMEGQRKKLASGELQVVGKDKYGGILVGYAAESTATGRPKTQWASKAHSATDHGSSMLRRVIPNRSFPYPKSLYAVEDVLRFFVGPNKRAVILDFFAGSGTTAHAVMRLNRQDSGRRQCISVTNNEVAADEHAALRKQGLRPGDTEWERWGICDYITKPRVEAAITGQTPDSEPIKGDYKFTDEFPMAQGFEENAAFFTLTYENPIAVSHDLAFQRIAPLLWMRAGCQGDRIDSIPSKGWQVAETYALLCDLDHTTAFCRAVKKAAGVCIAYVVTDDERRFQAVARRLPDSVEPIRLYESYFSNFQFVNGE